MPDTKPTTTGAPLAKANDPDGSANLGGEVSTEVAQAAARLNAETVVGLQTALRDAEAREVHALRVLQHLLAYIAGYEDDGWQFPADHGCPDCTLGTVPDKLNTGPCPRHRAVRLLAKENKP